MRGSIVASSDPNDPSQTRRRLRRSRPGLYLVLSISLLAADPRMALATDAGAPAANDAEQRLPLAKAKYEEGVEAYRAARYADAVRLFLEADALSPSAALSYNTARAYEKLGDDAHTLRWYRNYLRLSPDAKNRAEVESYVRSLSAALAKQGIQQLTVVTTPPGATVAIDGSPLGVSPLTVELRPGTHTAQVSLRGFSDVNGQFVLPEATPIDLSVTLQPAPAGVRPPPAASRGSERRFGIAPYLTLGAAAVCLGSAGVFEALRRSSQNSARSEQVQLAYENDIDDMNSRQTTARVLLGVGGVLAATGATLLVLNTRVTPESRARVAAVPGGATFSLEHRF
ncbi:MAG TPA: PEGA domain-containing protein [Polyangiaceae bacterium]|nr:PEGA domain-containing protein [Polyangiaceae bacterium]